MSNIQIIVDSSCDIPQERLEELDLVLLPLTILFGEEQFVDYKEMNDTKFCQMLKSSKAHPTTAQVTSDQAQVALKKCLDNKKEILAITISSVGSGTYSALHIAKRNLEEEAGHELPIRIIDSRAFTTLYALAVYDAVKMRDSGASLNEIAEATEKSCNDGRYAFLALFTDLNFLKKGGRLKAGTALICGILGIMPILTIEDGLVIPKGKARGFDNANDVLIGFMKDDCPSGKIKRLHIIHNGLEDKIKKFIDLVKQNFEVGTIDIGHPFGTIMTHSGKDFLVFSYDKD